MKPTSTLRLGVLLGLALLAVGLGVISFERRIEGFRTLGFEIALAPGHLEVGSVNDATTGLQTGDRLVVANGVEIGSATELRRVLGGRPESSLLVARGEQIETVRYLRPALDIDVPYLVLALIGFTYLLIGLYTWIRQRERQSRLFYLWCLTSALAYLLSPRLPPESGIDKLIYGFDELARLLLAPLTAHLFLIFPSVLEPKRLGRWFGARVQAFFYLPAAALATLQADLLFFGGRFVFGRPTASAIQLLDRLGLIHLVLGGVVAFAAIAWRLVAHRRESSEQGVGSEVERQVRWIAYGLAGGYLPFVLFYLLPQVFGATNSELRTALAVVPLALVPLTFAYAILRYKLWDIEVVVRDTASAALTLLLGLIGFSLVNLAIGRGLSSELVAARTFLSFASGIGIAGLLVPTRRTISTALERLQYGGLFAKRRALASFGRELLHERDLERLCSALLVELEDALELDRANLYLANRQELDELFAVRRPPVGAAWVEPLVILENDLGEGLWQRPFRSLVDLAPDSIPAGIIGELFSAGYRVAFPLTVRGNRVGIVVVGSKPDRAPLSSEDVELVRTLLAQAALAIENARLVDQLQDRLAEVERLREYSAGIFESSPAGIAVLDQGDRVLSINAALARLVDPPFSTNPELAVGRELGEILPIGTLPVLGAAPVEVGCVGRDGEERHLQISVADFRRSPEQRLRILVVHDVTERFMMETALRDQDRLAALGKLAAGVAHEVNTPITGISSYAQMLLADTPEGDPHRTILEKMERQTFRASRIVNNLLELARQRPTERGPVDLGRVVSDALDALVDRFTKRKIQIDWSAPDVPLVIEASEGEIHQVLTNLIVNALDAMAPNGTVPPTSGSAGRLSVDLQLADDDKIVIRVADTGPGIPPTKLDKIFQPFFTTKQSSGGTGLGLAISSDIVARHGGRLMAENLAEGGARFTVELPRTGAPHA